MLKPEEETENNGKVRHYIFESVGLQHFCFKEIKMRTIPWRELYTDKLLSQIVMVLAVRDPATINVLVRKINETSVTCYCYPPSQC